MRSKEHTSARVLTTTSGASLPTWMMPMSAQVRCILGDSNEVSRARGNLLIASWADVTLECFIGLHSAGFNGAVELAVP
jgi:hypothetical protein